jgi:hypothetical protein
MSEQNENRQHESNQASDVDLTEELRKFGQNVEQAVRNVAEHERMKSMQRDIASGMEEFFGQIHQAARGLQADQRMKDVSERGQQAVQDLQQNPHVKDFQQTLARGVAFFNQQLDDFSERMRASEQAQSNSKPGSQGVNIDIEEEDAAGGASSTTSTSTGTGQATHTGQTTKLDPDDK